MKKNKKAIIICIFSALIIFTAVSFTVAAIESNYYDIDPANGIDIMEGFEVGMFIVLGGFIVFYELDLFYTTYYFLVKPKTITKTILNIICNLSLLMVFFTDYLAGALSTHLTIFKEEWLFPLLLVFIYIVLRIVYCIISANTSPSKSSKEIL